MKFIKKFISLFIKKVPEGESAPLYMGAFYRDFLTNKTWGCVIGFNIPLYFIIEIYFILRKGIPTFNKVKSK